MDEKCHSMKATLKIIIILIFSFTGICNGQSKKIEKAKQDLIKAKNSIDSIDAYNELAWVYRDTIRETALVYAKLAQKMAMHVAYDKGLGDSYMRIGLIHKKNGTFDLAISAYDKAASIRKKINDLAGAAGTYNALGIIAKDQRNFEIAKQYYRTSFEILGDDSSPKFEAAKSRALNGIGQIYFLERDYLKAMSVYDSSLAIRNRLEDSVPIAECLLNIGSLNTKLRNFQKAEQQLNQALGIYTRHNNKKGLGRVHINLGVNAFYGDRFKESQFHFEEARSLESYLEKQDSALIAKNLGTIHYNLIQPELALQEYHKSLDQFQEIGNPGEITNLNYEIGLVHLHLSNEFSKAIRYFNEALSTAQKQENSPLIQVYNIYYGLSMAYQKMNEPEKALHFMNVHISMKDTLQKNTMDALNFKMDYEKTLQEKELATLEFKRKSTIFLSIFLVWIILCAAVLFLYYQRRKVKRAQASIDLILYEQEQKSINDRLSGQEIERKRIAKDLHDRLGSMLSTVKVYFNALDSKMDLVLDESRQQYQKANELLDEACDELRKIAYNMESGLLTKFGLIPQVESLAATLTESGKIK